MQIVHKFWDHAGSKINVIKAKCLLLSRLKKKNIYIEINWIKVDKIAVKCLGIYILGIIKNNDISKIYITIWKIVLNHGNAEINFIWSAWIINTLAISKHI